MKEIELIRGDTSPVYKFQRISENGVIETKATKMWITFKENPNEKKFVFQKTLENGIDFSEEDFCYRFKINSEDTENLYASDYGFDIAIINESGEKKTILNKGVLKLIEHYTHKENEV